MAHSPGASWMRCSPIRGFAFEGLSGSSAGAMNAVVLANGWIKGGRDGARQALADFWTAVGKQMPMGMVTQGEGDAISLSPASKLLASWAGYFSPSQLNPFDLNPLRDLIEQPGRLRAVACAPARSSCSSVPRRPTPASCACFARRTHPGHAAGLRLPAQDPSCGGDRRRALLGRRLLGESCGLPAVLRLRFERRAAGAVEPRCSATTRRARSKRSRPASSSWLSARTSCARCGCSRRRPTLRVQDFSRWAGSSDACRRCGST